MQRCEALAELDDARGLALGMQYAAYGYNDRSRAVAVKTVGRLSSHDPEATVRLLTALLDDPEQPPREAAAEGLARTKSKDALAPLQAIASATRTPTSGARPRSWSPSSRQAWPRPARSRPKKSDG